tara:strand:+ start:61357 stop:62664 length:1308 start_codon:yes stop_codon:yes gene_type:complete
MRQPVSGFSKKSKEQKIEWLLATYFKDADDVKKIIQQYYNSDDALQQLHDDFIENAITNYFLPFGVAPNFLLNGQLYAIPMVTEESSVVAAASNAAKFWLERGGFTSEVISTVKNGQVHLDYYGDANVLTEFFEATKPKLIASLDALQKNMKRRGGGLLDIEFLDASETLEGYFQLHCTFETLDAMGANFINSCLEQIATTFTTEAQNYKAFTQKKPRVVMSILSNYVPECLVRAEVHCKVEDLTQKEVSGEVFAKNFVRAINIAKSETRRAVTHNKGIMNGIDAVVLATGNDFRAVEAGVHAYAAKNGYYGSLTHAQVEDGVFRFWIELPLALGTVGGLTSLHPLAKFALQLLQNPNARELMQLVAAAGLAQNFAAIKSLVTVGIQKGHMKMHLMNILNQLEASSTEKEKALKHFKEISVSHSAVENYIEELRS